MNILDPEKLCTSRLFREHCTWLDQTYVKDMSLINRKMENIILIDNSPNSYRLQPENALPCTTWYNDPEDTELFDFIPLLTGLSKIKDVRVVLSQVHENHQLDMPLALEMVRQLQFEEDGEEESVHNDHISESDHREEIIFGEPIKNTVSLPKGISLKTQVGNRNQTGKSSLSSKISPNKADRVSNHSMRLSARNTSSFTKGKAPAEVK